MPKLSVAQRFIVEFLIILARLIPADLRFEVVVKAFVAGISHVQALGGTAFHR